MQASALFQVTEMRMIQDSAGYNPFLAQPANRSNGHAGTAVAADAAPERGSIDAPARAVGNMDENIIWQTRDHAPTAYENRLGDALEAAFESGADSPEAMAAHLNGAGVHAPDGTPWTGASFEAAMRELGA
jgi:hypothetical protein